MNNGNGPPARMEFPGSPDGKLKSHLQWPYKIMSTRGDKFPITPVDL